LENSLIISHIDNLSDVCPTICPTGVRRFVHLSDKVYTYSMNKVSISKAKRDKIELCLYAGAGAMIMITSMESGICTDKVIQVRDRYIKEILDLLDNK